MDQFFPGNSTINVSDAIIEDISTDNNTTIVTISYTEEPNRRRNQTVKLVVGNNTLVLNESGNSIPTSSLRTEMTVDAIFSAAMTRSIPPQANAFVIRVVRRPLSDEITTGRIINVDRKARTFTTMRDRDISSIIQFNVPTNARIFDIFGQPMNFSRLTPGLRVRVRHAAFMTASIPPQTTAFEIRVIR